MVQSLGVECVIDYKARPFVEAAKAATPDGRGVDLILDCVGGAEYTRQNLEVLAYGGRLVLYGTMGGSIMPELDLRVVMRKALTIRGSTLRARPLGYKAGLVARFWTEARVGKFLAGGEFKNHIHAALDWSEAGKGHAMMEANENSGKILLTVDSSLE